MAEGFKDFAPGAVFSAGDVDDYLMRQTVMRFADATARDAALTAGIRTEGMVTYQKDVNEFTVYDGSSWISYGRAGGWISYTPTVTQLGAVSGTVVYSTYVKIGRLVIFHGRVNITGSGTASNKVTVSLPVNAAGSAASGIPIGTGYVYDASASPPLYMGQTQIDAAGTMAFQQTNSGAAGTAAPLSLLGASGAFTAALVSGDAVTWNVAYEAAS